jgi:hypothetical protein
LSFMLKMKVQISIFCSVELVSLKKVWWI